MFTDYETGAQQQGQTQKLTPQGPETRLREIIPVPMFRLSFMYLYTELGGATSVRVDLEARGGTFLPCGIAQWERCQLALGSWSESVQVYWVFD
jgi:hypothetical protein